MLRRLPRSTPGAVKLILPRTDATGAINLGLAHELSLSRPATSRRPAENPPQLTSIIGEAAGHVVTVRAPCQPRAWQGAVRPHRRHLNWLDLTEGRAHRYWRMDVITRAHPRAGP